MDYIPIEQCEFTHEALWKMYQDVTGELENVNKQFGEFKVTAETEKRNLQMKNVQLQATANAEHDREIAETPKSEHERKMDNIRDMIKNTKLYE